MKLNIKKLFKNNRGYLLVILGFVTVLFLEGLLYLSTLGDFFTRFKIETGHYTPELGGVNSDLNFYPNILFNKASEYFSYFGFFFFFVLISMSYIILAREKRAFFLIMWFSSVLLFLQYGSMNPFNYTLLNRIGRFLNVLTIPITLIISYFLIKNKIPFKNIILIVFTGFLFITSMYYIIKITLYMNQAMSDFKAVANFLKTQPKKNVYADYDTNGKLSFLLAYQWTDYFKNIENVKNSSELNDSYVVVDASRGFVEIPELRRSLPSFIYNPPENWKEILVVKESYLDFYGTYDTKVYYVP
jgi:hypothetical protein